MTRIRQLRSICIVVTIILIAQLLVVQAMAASGELHQCLHNDAHDSGHECAVTLMLAGGYDSVVPDIVPVEFIPERPPVVVVVPEGMNSEPGHLVGGVLAHAPPRGP